MKPTTRKSQSTSKEKNRFQSMTLSQHFPDIAAEPKSARGGGREEAILAGAMLAIRQAAARAMHCTGAEKFGLTEEDLVSVGVIAALETIPRFDETKATFLTYALRRIQGGMIDYIRSNSPVPRCQMDKLKRHYETDAGALVGADEAKPAQKGSRFVESQKSANLAYADAALSPINLDALSFDDSSDRLLHDVIGSDRIYGDGGPSDIDRMVLREVIAATTEYTGTVFEGPLALTSVEREVLDMTLQGYSQVEIGSKVALTGSRVSQLYESILRKMRRYTELDPNLSAASVRAKAG
jgi:RNA polymerase sigma factor (sigma-70 family)